MNDPISFGLDPELARQTRTGHWVLFVAGSLLMIPTTIFFCLFFVSSNRLRMNPELVLFLAATGSGVLGWSMLGLLFFKRSDPHWHRFAWSLVLLFAVVAGWGCLYFVSHESFLISYLSPVIIVCAISLVISCQNLALTSRSLKTLKDKTASLRPDSWK